MIRLSSRRPTITPSQLRAFRPRAEGLEERQLLAAGALDSTFNATGYALEGPMTAYAVQIDSAGDILAAGSSGGSSSDFRVVRTTPSGALDTAFGTNGSVTTDFAGRSDRADALAVLPDGRIVVAGTAGNVHAVTVKGKTTNYLDNDFGLVCYLANGSLDPSFGNGGKVTTNISNYSTLDQNYQSDKGWAMAVQGDGKIVVGGQSWTGSGITEGVLVRYNANGSLDTTFGGSGIVHIPTPTGFRSDGVWHVEIQRDPTNFANDKIVTMEAPNALDSSGNLHWSVAVSRYKLDGTPDASFGTNGRVITTKPGQAYAWSMALQPDGSVVVGGYYDYQNGTPTDLALFRYTAAGIPDPSFGSGGGVLFDAGSTPGTADYGYAVAIQHDGKILLGGQSSSSSLASSALSIVARFQANGAIDTTFGTNGVARNTFTNSESSFRGLAIQPNDGKIVAVGSARTQVTSTTSKYDILIARYLGDPSPLRASAIAPAPVHESITAAQARPTLAQALALWRAGGADTSRLGRIDLAIADLGGARLGEASGSTITLDDNAAGWGWNVGRAAGRGRKSVSGRMDLLSALVHEVGHLLGRDHAEGGVMAETLAPGVRQIATNRVIVADTTSGRDHPLAAIPGASSRFSLRTFRGHGWKTRVTARS